MGIFKRVRALEEAEEERRWEERRRLAIWSNEHAVIESRRDDIWFCPYGYVGFPLFADPKKWPFGKDACRELISALEELLDCDG